MKAATGLEIPVREVAALLSTAIRARRERVWEKAREDLTTGVEIVKRAIKSLTGGSDSPLDLKLVPVGDLSFDLMLDYDGQKFRLDHFVFDAAGHYPILIPTTRPEGGERLALRNQNELLTRLLSHFGDCRLGTVELLDKCAAKADSERTSCRG